MKNNTLLNLIKEIKEYNNLLDQTILLNWLRANTELYEKGKECELLEIVKEFLDDFLNQSLIKILKHIVEEVEKIEGIDIKGARGWREINPHLCLSEERENELIIKQGVKDEILSLIKSALKEIK